MVQAFYKEYEYVADKEGKGKIKFRHTFIGMDDWLLFSYVSCS